MRIALNVKYFFAKGGAQTYLRYLSRGLLDAGHAVDVFAMEGPGELPCTSFHRIGVASFPKALRDYRFAVNSERVLREADHDVIFGEQKACYLDVVRPGGGIWRQYIEREIRSLEGRRIPALLRRLSLKEYMNSLLEQKLYACPRLKHVIVNSKATAEALSREYGLTDDKVHVIYNGVDTARFHPDRRAEARAQARKSLGIAQDDYVILFLATNFRLKGLRPLLRAVAQVAEQLPSPRVRLLAAGQNHRGPYARLADSLGLGGSAILLGPQEPDDLYAAADVLAHPTFHDPCANVCLEAMACGLPVVTTRANGASELIQDGESGFVVDDALDVEEIANRLRALADEGLRRTMGQSAREAVAELTPERNIGQVLQVLEAAARG